MPPLTTLRDLSGATATRALPSPTGVVSSEALQAASLAAIADLFGIVVADAGAIPD